MTTDKQVADSLTTQGKTISQEEAPPQTIIGTFDTRKSVVDAAIRAREHVGVGLANRIMMKYGVKLADLPEGKWQEAGEWFTSMIIPPVADGGAEGIIRPGKFASAGIVPDSIRESIIPTNFDGDGPGEEDGPWAKGWEDRAGGPTIIRDVERQQLVNAEVRRQTVQAEAMVNLAVGVTLIKEHLALIGHEDDKFAGHLAKRQITVSLKDLIEFQRLYTVTQEIQPDGGFIISISPKEV